MIWEVISLISNSGTCLDCRKTGYQPYSQSLLQELIGKSHHYRLEPILMDELDLDWQRQEWVLQVSIREKMQACLLTGEMLHSP